MLKATPNSVKLFMQSGDKASATKGVDTVTAGPSTVLKALTLLDFFNERRHSIGLSDFAKLSGYNKSTTLRFLTALESKGFVEQDEKTRLYNLGPAFLRFAQLREACFPVVDAVNTIARDLNTSTGETAHVSAVSGEWLVSVGVAESQKANRVIVEPGEPCPYHATASGLAYLAFATPGFVEAALGRELEAHTSDTLTNPRLIYEKLEAVRKTGISYSSGTYEEEVLGVAAPYFGPGGRICGAAAIALPAVRATDARMVIIEESIRTAAKRLTALHGGTYPEDFPY
ncbi:IclR family transcriptional regulator [Ruegeria sp.]|uniref:IclR family transcriptional regulator n=1 Tax=Ruegeria sp. TaxID=1879320 RepID=UPI002317D8EE|nr:IclR family transcriptional regulator [Ruegeria sp.]MDA7967103.1 IclR family transcriptional regulator [Ruegeria sp.]